MTNHYLTPEGFEKIKQELHYLKNTKRKEVIDRIQAAKELGDLSENAEYSDAKDEQSFIEGKILELENLINKAQVITEHQNLNEVGIGCTIAIDCDGKKQEFTIVGSNEADPSKGYISNESPMGRAFLGKKIGDVVEVKAPKGALRCTILSIQK